MGVSIETGDPYSEVSCCVQCNLVGNKADLLNEPIDTLGHVKLPIAAVDGRLASHVLRILLAVDLFADQPIRCATTTPAQNAFAGFELSQTICDQALTHCQLWIWRDTDLELVCIGKQVRSCVVTLFQLLLHIRRLAKTSRQDKMADLSIWKLVRETA